MGAIRHKSVRPETVALLEIQTPSLTVTQTVLIEAKEGLTVTVSHENSWTRELVAASGDCGCTRTRPARIRRLHFDCCRSLKRSRLNVHPGPNLERGDAFEEERVRSYFQKVDHLIAGAWALVATRSDPPDLSWLAD